MAIRRPWRKSASSSSARSGPTLLTSTATTIGCSWGQASSPRPRGGSVYLDSESVLFGDSCVALQRWMRARGIELHEGESREPVDHIGRMLVLLSWLCDNQPDQVIPFMEEHLMTWAPRYFAQLEPAAAGTLYEPLGHLASLTLEGVPLLRQS